jgi:hypothetical protein
MICKNGVRGAGQRECSCESQIYTIKRTRLDYLEIIISYALLYKVGLFAKVLHLYLDLLMTID